MIFNPINRKKKSNSSGKVSLLQRYRYLADLFMMRWNGRKNFNNSINISRIHEYQTIATRHGIDLAASQILEIGVGQRPYLGITFFGKGYDYRGIDLDEPIYPLTFLKVLQLYRANGGVRLIKSLVRYLLFDRQEYRALLKDLGLVPTQLQQAKIFIQADAAYVNLGDLLGSSVDELAHDRTAIVVISEFVFEHIPRSDLKLILDNLRSFVDQSRRKLLLLTRPTIFTGICGSHLTEWYPHNVYRTKPKRSQPWEHLRKNRFAADTYLNRMSRADYRDCFRSCGFDIVRETVQHPGLGSKYLESADLREELANYPDEELLSNEVMFELVPTKDMFV